MHSFPSVAVAEKVDRAMFDNEIRPMNQPVILKGLVAHWPCVAAAQAGPRTLGDWLESRDSGLPLQVSVLPPEGQGRFFYNEQKTGFNFSNQNRSLRDVVDKLLNHAHTGESVYVQAADTDRHLPLTVSELDMPLLSPQVRPRFWIGNTLRTQTHFDYSSNIACHIAGEKVFTLFPPEQTPNLYPAPVDMTPAGVPISLVSLEAPDFERFPRLKDALAAGRRARLEPGDAIYIPYLWWHHVQTTGPLNMLVNYWWSDARPDIYSPTSLLFLAALSVKRLPPAQRDAWRPLFDYFIFNSHGDPMAEAGGLPSIFRDQLTPDEVETFKGHLRKRLTL
ncbi:transcription factor jumonji domain-containing protein [Asticcacaulis biprosthecium C19]|uniref:Transcription factor jumonji domain-containing protein n=1 Tax=Asticcacaulis biprosthecium C19 TaxID=715226 RepID=F4QTN9_9CAUL|nr:cupin-like domain-containing protein [Asticcacaulis biprosthecium]EGF89189.1 transcription factor jumonji domain-containing protein [Asticcacaulis biprosthecium C19]